MNSSVRPRRFWFDPRFAIGLVLVAVSVAGVVGIVSSVDATSPVYAARDSFSPGDRISEDDLVEVSARLVGVDDLYLVPGDIPDDGLIVTKAVATGELIPSSAVGSPSGLRYASIVVTVPGQLPASIAPGSSVDVWAATEDETNLFGPPSVIVSSAIVVRLVEDEGIVAGGDTSSLELLVARSKVARVLEAIANDDALSVVPTSIPAKG